MSPDVPKKRPVIEYNEYNPPPVLPQSRQPAEDQSAVYLRKIYRFLVGGAIGGLIGIVLYFLIVYF